jgi:hypothetical protein|tara:strand:- start:744 stop:989 length:246 start_codon:yes stop_codon:yes gene_type:complete
MNNTQQQGINIDFKNTTAIEGFDGGHLFGQAFVLRKVSKFVAGTDEDAMLPIPVFYDLETKKIIKDSLPKELRAEYEEITL